MKNKYFLLVFLLPVFIFSQSVPSPVEHPEAAPPANPIIFKYDEAGNQIFRGTTIGPVTPEQPKSLSGNVIEEDQFWLGIQIYPVPVKDVLNIAWNEENKELIDNVTLYQHNSMAFLFEQKNYPNLNRQLQIDMSSYYMGVYILNFQLKDGRVMSRNIIKE